ncbi:MAG: UDP-3-O-acyl-N-acetylglucosamine deacetylase [Nanoarchaeota archaeon]
MIYQKTLSNTLYLSGREGYGGNLVQVELHPAEPGTGILFQTSYGDVPARLEHAFSSRRSILLQKGSAQVIHAEHLLATLFAYGVNNACVSLKREPTLSYSLLKRVGLATDIEVVPFFSQLERTVCDAIEKTGLEEQGKPLTYLKPDGLICDKKLSFSPIPHPSLIIKATTRYPLPGEQSREVTITSQNYKDSIAPSRALVYVPSWLPKFVASTLMTCIYPSFGIGHGFTDKNVFYLSSNPLQWSTVIYHTIMDRLGAIALLDGRLNYTKIYIQFSNHAHDLDFLKKHQSRFERTTLD